MRKKASDVGFLLEASQPKFWEVFEDVLLRPGSRQDEMPPGLSQPHLGSEAVTLILWLPVILPPAIPASVSPSVK